MDTSRSGAVERIFTYEKVPFPECRWTFQKQGGAQRSAGAGEPRPVQISAGCGGPMRRHTSDRPAQVYRNRRKISVRYSIVAQPFAQERRLLCKHLWSLLDLELVEKFNHGITKFVARVCMRGDFRE